MADTITTQFHAFPEFLTSNDLVELGLYGSSDGVYLARLRGKSPDFIKMGRRVLYPKESVINFLQQRLRSGNLPSLSKTKVGEESTC